MRFERRRRRAGFLLRCLTVPGALAAARVLGGGQAAAVTAGALHALAYGGLLAGFSLSLLPGRTAVATAAARRLNPRFRPDMVGYTRRVTWAWCLLFAGELAASAALRLCAGRAAWLAFVSLGHLLPVGALLAGEYMVRRAVFGRDGTDWATMLRGLRGPPR